MSLVMIDLEIYFDVGHCNGSMSLEIMYNNNTLHKVENIIDRSYHYKTKIVLPGSLQFILGNKNMMTDTKVDDQGMILADKYIKLNKLILGKVEVSESTLFNICNYNTIQGTEFNTYWGRPGSVMIEFNAREVVEWHLLNNYINCNI